MIEPEMAFYDLEDNMNLAEAFIKYVINHALENNKDDLTFPAQRQEEEEKTKPQNERSEMGLLEKLNFICKQRFPEAGPIPKQSTYWEKAIITRKRNFSTW